MRLRIAQEVPDTQAEGPGTRYAVWVQGCSLRCPGCCNPEMFVHGKGGHELEAAELTSRIIATKGLEGLSVLGGEPFEQAAGLAEVAKEVRSAGLSVMVYSGFTLAELQARAEAGFEGTAALLGEIDLLVDGRYDQSQPEKQRRWVGSSNQVMHFLSPRYEPAESRFSTPNTVELRFENGTLTINGWPDAADALRAQVSSK